MYDDHYGLSARPFQLTPDPKFWFDIATHRKAMAYLGYGLSQGEGFIVVTGDVGAGKTTLVGHLMAKIDREQLQVVKIASTQIEPEDLLRMVAAGLDVEARGLNKAELLAAIERGLHAVARSGRRTLLIVDEAQALPVAALEELRMLSNFQAGGHALLQIFLLGQPEFRQRLQGSDRLEQLRQRVIAMHHLDPMGPDEVEPYMAHRLNIVGWNGRPRFTGDAFDALFHGSGGVPRRLNQLAGRVLLHGAIERIEVIDGDVVRAVVADTAVETPQPFAARPGPLPLRAAMEPLPMVRSPEPAPSAAISVAPPTAVEPVESPPQPAPEPEPAPAAAVAESSPVDACELTQGAVADDTLLARVASLEARIEEQDAAMRRVLTLMVDWVERGERPNAATLRA